MQGGLARGDLLSVARFLFPHLLPTQGGLYSEIEMRADAKTAASANKVTNRVASVKAPQAEAGAPAGLLS